MKMDVASMKLLYPKEYYRTLSAEELVEEFKWYLERKHFYFLVERKAEDELHSMYTRLVYAFQEYATRREADVHTLSQLKKIIDHIDDHIRLDVKLIEKRCLSLPGKSCFTVCSSREIEKVGWSWCAG